MTLTSLRDCFSHPVSWLRAHHHSTLTHALPSPHHVDPQKTPDDIRDLYVFDRALRLVVLDALDRVKVAVRAALTDHMSTTYEVIRSSMAKPTIRRDQASWRAQVEGARGGAVFGDVGQPQPVRCSEVKTRSTRSSGTGGPGRR